MSLFLVFLFFFSGCTTTFAMKPSQTQRKKFVEDNSIKNDRIREAILTGEVVLGMTEEQVLASWGQPDDTSSWKKNDRWMEEGEEIWFYNSSMLSWGRRIVEFRNGVVVRKNVTYK